METQLEQLVSLYDRGAIDRRQLLGGLVGLGACGAVSSQAVGNPSGEPLFRAKTINHLTLYSRDVGRSKAFYQRVTGLPIRDEASDFCEFRLERGFLGLYALEAERHPGFDHFCFGIEGYSAKQVHAALTAAVPESQPTIENEDQVYVRDPDGVRVQFADVNYKR
jgi:catechol 2,3-dioxygenase-like lactoylglutathione lyase family enzyme